MPTTRSSRAIQTAIFRLALAFLLIALAAASSPAQTPANDDNPMGSACDPGCCCLTPPPRCDWYVRVEGIALQRQVLQNTTFAAGTMSLLVGSVTTNAGGTTTTVGGTTTGTSVVGGTTTMAGGTTTIAPVYSTEIQPLLTSDSLGTPFAAGARLLVGHTFGDSGHQIEASYFALSQYNNSASVTDPNAKIMSPFTNFGNPANGAVDNNALVQVQETSNLENAELNWKTLLPTPPGMTLNLLMGIRYDGVREGFGYTSYQSLAPSPPPAPNMNVFSHTVNDLWGAQIGSTVDFNVYPNTWIDFSIKGALCNNAATSSLDADSPSAGVNYHGTNSQNVTAYVEDFNLAIFWQPIPHLTTHIGYQAILMQGLVLASQNFAPNIGVLENNPALQPPPLNGRGNVLYHGPSIGLEYAW